MQGNTLYTNPREVISRNLMQQTCWYVLAGGCTFPAVKLAFGRPRLRERELMNETVSDQYRKFEGEFSLTIYCAWRLSRETTWLTSHRDEESRARAHLDALLNRPVASVEISQMWDIVLGFDSGHVIRAFSDLVSADVARVNWSYWDERHGFVVRSGGQVEVSSRQQG